MSAPTKERVLWTRVTANELTGRFPFAGEPVFTADVWPTRMGEVAFAVYDVRSGMQRAIGTRGTVRAAQDAAQRWCRENVA